MLLGEQFLVRSVDCVSRWGRGCHTRPPMCVCVGGLMQMSPRACSSVTGHALSELFSLQLDFDLGLPHTEAIHSSSFPPPPLPARPMGVGWPVPGLLQLPSCSWAQMGPERGRGGGLLTAPPPFPPESLALPVPQFLSGEH